jgi:hypothetical protein
MLELSFQPIDLFPCSFFSGSLALADKQLREYPLVLLFFWLASQPAVGLHLP